MFDLIFLAGLWAPMCGHRWSAQGGQGTGKPWRQCAGGHEVAQNSPLFFSEIKWKEFLNFRIH